MALSKLGNFVELVDNRNSDQKIKTVFGLNNKKEFMPTVATIDENSDLSKYKIVEKGMFVFSGMQTGRDQNIRLGHSNYDYPFVISPAYTTFKVFNIIPTYFFMIFKSPEMDRYGAFLSDSSVRSNLDWEVFTNIELDIPPIEVQQKVVDVYLSMVANQKVYEKGLDDLKLTCDAYIENLRKKHELHNLADFLEETKEINTDNKVLFERGLNKLKGFVKPSAMSNNVDLSKRKIVRHNHFVYPSPHFGEQGTIGLFKEDACIMSQMYSTFRVIDNRLNPDYLYLWFKRNEFMRYAFFAASDSVRDTFDFKKLCDYQIPIPSINIQKDIVEVFEAYEMRKRINENLKKQINEICPVLIKGSIDLSQ